MTSYSSPEDASAFIEEAKAVFPQLEKLGERSEDFSVEQAFELAVAFPAWAQPLAFYALGGLDLDEDEAALLGRKIGDFAQESWLAENVTHLKVAV